ncbi:unnamed protein product [Gongylonema pulchrum]|uniref:G_PROTEIN_RECEP_F1_2 domain-containing protein n=1 Tax=Gongylonema pulchrum TaxID=637853 RepID=A0A183CV35_9BILA|nr:unnamed protein product [Gongylonema pulchrum]
MFSEQCIQVLRPPLLSRLFFLHILQQTNASFEIVSEQDLLEYQKLIPWQAMTLLIGSVGVVINLLLLTVFCGFSTFWSRYKLFICLAVGDLFNCLGIALLGLNRRYLFKEVTERGYAIPQVGFHAAFSSALITEAKTDMDRLRQKISGLCALFGKVAGTKRNVVIELESQRAWVEYSTSPGELNPISDATLAGLTPISCAMKAYVWIRLIGTLWPPAIQLAIGADRAASILKPFWHRRYIDNKDWQLGVTTFLFVMVSLFAGLLIVLMNSDRTVIFYCGRKATFSNGFGYYVYFAEVSFLYFAINMKRLHV